MPVNSRIVANLARLPPELAFDIIDDLYLWDVLKLIRQDNARVNSHLMGSRRYGPLLGKDPESFAEGCKLVKKYMDFAARWNVRISTYDWGFHRYTHCINPKGREYSYPRWHFAIIDDLHIRIWSEFSGLYTGVHDLLLPYTKDSKAIPNVTIYSTLEEWQEYWDIVTEAKAVLSQKCSDQILECARLLEENPDILKRTTDPEQKQRENIQHIVSRMKYAAEQVLRRHVRNFRRIEYLSYDFFAVIPFDSALERLLFLMEKHKLNSGDQLLSHQPPAIRSLARMVVDGLPYFYSQKPARPVGVLLDSDEDTEKIYPRTQYSPWSPEQGQNDEENSGSAKFTPSVQKSLNEWRRTHAFQIYAPHSRLEENWVGCFVELYRFLEGLEKEQS